MKVELDSDDMLLLPGKVARVALFLGSSPKIRHLTPLFSRAAMPDYSY